MHENEIATKIVDAAFKIHKTVGPGLLESVYETLTAYELTEARPSLYPSTNDSCLFMNKYDLTKGFEQI